MPNYQPGSLRFSARRLAVFRFVQLSISVIVPQRFIVGRWRVRTLDRRTEARLDKTRAALFTFREPTDGRGVTGGSGGNEGDGCNDGYEGASHV